MYQQQRSIRKTICFLAILAIAASSTAAHAFRMIQNTYTGPVTSGYPVPCNAPRGFAHWGTVNITWGLNPANQGSSKAAALQLALQSWTNVSGADFVLNYSGLTSAGFAVDGVNTVVWKTGNGCVGSCLALTMLVLQTGQEIVESDITFNDLRSWRTDGTDIDTEAVAAHEFGHSLGIHHTDLRSTPRPTMYWSYFGATGRSLDADDRARLIHAMRMARRTVKTPDALARLFEDCIM